MYYTIKGFEDLSAQRVFDMSVNHLRKQKARSMSPGGPNEYPVCAYRGEQGMMCAAGIFLNDRDAKLCEGKSWDWLADNKMVPTNHHNLIVALQCCHDYLIVPEWETRLKKIARDFNLIYNPPE